MEQKFCQCCGMPLGQTDELYGTNADGGKSEDYCKYCCKDGVLPDCTMDEMIEFSVGPMVEANPGMTKEAARSMMQQFFPTLKHWKKV